MTDAMLVREYAQTQSPAALAELVARHSQWVYSAALRMVADKDLAQDVAQAVFLVLVRKAATLEDKPVNAWLFRVTRFAAKHAMRDRARRQRHERIAATMFKANSPQAWMMIAPLLDEMVGRLKASERRAILLRFYQGKKMAEVGEALGVSEEAAKKRVGKAVKRLREMLAARGVNVPSDAMGIILLEHITQTPLVKFIPRVKTPASRALSISNGVISMMALAKIKLAALVVLTIGLVPAGLAMALQSSAPPATMPQQDAADLYGQAFAAIQLDSPAATSTLYPDYGPSSADWRDLESKEWAADAKVRKLVHEARSIQTVKWPDIRKETLAYYNGLRNLANHIGDAALYAEIQGDHAQAIGLIDDLRHMDKLLFDDSDHHVLQPLIAMGVDALAMYRLESITTTIALTDDPKNIKDVKVQTANDLIAELLDRSGALLRLAPSVGKLDPTVTTRGKNSARTTGKRVATENALAAMSLACHVYKFENGHWPTTLNDLIPNYLPHAVIDPGGDGKEVLGYTVIAGGLPDGTDRPLVYSRDGSSDGLLIPANHILLGYYVGDFSKSVASMQTHAGQFRDVALWQPIANYKGPAVIPLPLEPAVNPPAATEPGAAAE